MAEPEQTEKTFPPRRVGVREFRGNPVVLVFYPADWSPVCGDQLAIYNELDSE